MKMINSLLALCLLASVTAHAGQKVSTPEDIALALIDDAAADSWAEGGNVESLDFNSLKCDLKSGNCELAFRLKKYDVSGVDSKCLLKGITGYDRLIEVDAYGFVLKSGIMDQINTCFDQLL